MPIVKIGTGTPGKIAISPTIENQPATADTASAEHNKSAMKNIYEIPLL